MGDPLKSRAFTALVAGVAALWANPAFAWGPEAHRTVCLVAWGELSESGRAALRDLLALQSSEQFADTCTWADDVRTERPETAPWHFIVIPKTARSIDLGRDCPATTSCVVDQIEKQAARLKSDIPKTQRAEALKFLAHLVGDLHHPLHVGFAEDQRGQTIEVTFLGRPTNMRALWDEGLLEGPAPRPVGPTPHLNKALRELNRSRWGAGTVHDWAQETLWLMRTPSTGYVGNPGGVAFDEVYAAQNTPVAVDQLEKAGIRLAELLGDAFP